MSTDLIVSNLSPPLDGNMSTSLVEEFRELERRFALSDWKLVALDGGRFAEIASRVVYHMDSGTLNPNKSMDSCLSYVENDSSKHTKKYLTRRDALHLCKVLRLIYKFRSQRGAIHIDLNYTASELDSSLILSLSRWVFSEILRIFWKGDKEEVARSIREIIRYPIPSIFEIDGRSLVLYPDCASDEEVLLLLHNSGETGLSRGEIGKSAMASSSSVTKAIKKLTSSSYRQVLQKPNKNYVLTPNGMGRIGKFLSEKSLKV